MLTANITVVLLFRVWIGIDYRVFIEHLPVGLISRKRLEIGDLILDLRLNLFVALGGLHLRKLSFLAVIVGEASLRFVFRHNVVPLPMCVHHVLLMGHLPISPLA